MSRRFLLPLAVALASLLGGCAVHATGSAAVVYTPPPPMRVEVRPAVPYYGAVWVDGYWAYRRGNYYWVNGYYTRSRPGYVYVAPRWQRSGSGYVYVGGGWQARGAVRGGNGRYDGPPPRRVVHAPPPRRVAAPPPRRGGPPGPPPHARGRGGVSGSVRVDGHGHGGDRGRGHGGDRGRGHDGHGRR